MPSAELRDAILFLAPGFIALRIYNAFAFRRPRTDWHWLVWSIIASLPIDFAARSLMAVVPVDWPRDVADGLMRVGFAVALGAILCVVWQTVYAAKDPRVRRFIGRFVDSGPVAEFPEHDPLCPGGQQ